MVGRCFLPCDPAPPKSEKVRCSPRLPPGNSRARGPVSGGPHKKVSEFLARQSGHADAPILFSTVYDSNLRDWIKSSRFERHHLARCKPWIRAHLVRFRPGILATAPLCEGSLVPDAWRNDLRSHTAGPT